MTKTPEERLLEVEERIGYVTESLDEVFKALNAIQGTLKVIVEANEKDKTNISKHLQQNELRMANLAGNILNVSLIIEEKVELTTKDIENINKKAEALKKQHPLPETNDSEVAGEEFGYDENVDEGGDFEVDTQESGGMTLPKPQTSGS